MELQFLRAADVHSAIEELLAEHDEIHWAVAWGVCSPLTKKLLAKRASFKAVTFGLSFSQTDPNLVDELVGVKGAYVVAKFPDGTFHPKVYAFRSGERAAAIVGSANFTPGGLGRNYEAGLLISGLAQDPVLADIFAFTAQSARLGQKVTEELAERYRLSCKRAARMPSPAKNPIADLAALTDKALASPLIRWSWAEYAREVRASQWHPTASSLELLQTAQAIFSSKPSFGDLSTLERKAIAGVIGDTEKVGDRRLDRDWGAFGSMRGAGDFKNRIVENDRSLARAIDSIPQKGEVTKIHYDRFARLFLKAFAKSDRVGGVATASRLLAMKRPDVFVCLCKPNRAGAAQLMDAPAKLTLANYWDRVIEVIRACDWYNADKPGSAQGRLWEHRAAMLDAILYRPL